MFNKKYALLVSVGVTLSWVFLFFTGRPMTSIPAAFFLLTSLLFFWKGYVLKKGNKFVYLWGVFYALATLTRMQYLMFLPIFFIFIFINERFKFLKNKTLWITVIIFLAMLIPHFILYSMNYGFFVVDIMNYYLGIGSDLPSSAATKTFSNLFDYFRDLPYLMTGKTALNLGSFTNILSVLLFISFIGGAIIFFIDLVFGFDKILRNKDLQKKLFLFLWIAVPFIFLGRITDYVEQRYAMPVLPILFLLVAISFVRVGELSKKYWESSENKKLILIFIILIILLIPNYLWADGLIENKKTSYLELKQAGLWLKENSDPGDVVLSRSMPQIIYYAERPTYPTGGNESAFLQNIEDLNPRFLILSVFEVHQQYEYAYPMTHNDTLIPIQAYEQGGQPVLIIYEFVEPLPQYTPTEPTPSSSENESNESSLPF